MIARHPWRHFVALGDSTTEGYGMDPVPGVEQLSWAQRLAAELARTQPELEFHNLARRNLRAAEVRARQLEPTLALQPDLVSILAGANDLLVPDFDPQAVEAELEPIYKTLAERDVFVFSFLYADLTRSGLLPDDAAAWLRPRLTALNQVIRAVAERHQVLLVDMFGDPQAADPGFWSADLQHLNARGQAYVAERTIRALEAALAGEAQAVPAAPR